MSDSCGWSLLKEPMKDPIRPCVQEKCPSKKQRTQGLIYRTSCL